jgi:VWFA-related protein
MKTCAAAGLLAVAVWRGALAADAVHQEQRPTFSSGVEAIRVDVLVTERGRAVTNLTAADFAVSDNGVPQTVDLVSHDQVPLNVVLTLDVSASLKGERLQQLRSAGSLLVGRLRPNDQAALVTFDDTVVLQAALSPDPGRLRGTIDAITGSGREGRTALVDALFASVLTAESDVGRALVVAFSDGVDTGSWLRSAAVLDVVKRSDAVVYAVTTRHSGRTPFIRDFTEASGGSWSEIDSTRDLAASFTGILDEFRHRYLVSYTPRGVVRNGWHAVSVQVNGRGRRVRARPGYWAAE